MGEADRISEFRKKKKNQFSFLSNNNQPLLYLFAINAILFVLMMTIQVSYNFGDQSVVKFNKDILQWIALPDNFSAFIKRPWTIFSFMFADTGTGLFRFAANMLWLWMFGQMLISAGYRRQLVPIYIYGGLVGGTLFLLTTLFTGSSGYFLLGANASIIALIAAACKFIPEQKFFQNIGRGISIWWILAIYIIIAFISVGSVSPIFYASLIGGLIAGFGFGYFFNKGKDLSDWMYVLVDKFSSVYGNNHSKKTNKDRTKLFYDTNGREPFKTRATITQEKIDAVLDKISLSGFSSLTEEEKNILKQAGESE